MTIDAILLNINPYEFKDESGRNIIGANCQVASRPEANGRSSLIGYQVDKLTFDFTTYQEIKAKLTSFVMKKVKLGVEVTRQGQKGEFSKFTVNAIDLIEK